MNELTMIGDLDQHLRQAGAVIAPSEQALAPLECTHYFLRPCLSRVSVVSLAVVRTTLARLAERVTPFPSDATRIVFRPPLVSTLKSRFQAGATARCRVVFDLDSDVEQPAQRPTVNMVVTTLCLWLDEYAPGETNWDEEQVVCFAGFFADKPQSWHVYFVGASWDPVPANSYTNQVAALAALNGRLLPLGLKADASITNSGLKYPFMDKYLANSYRGDSQQWVMHGNTPFFVSWNEFFAACDPLVAPEEVHRVATFRPLPVAAPAPVMRAAPVLAPGTGPVARLKNLFPQWMECTFRERPGPGGSRLLLPRSNYCPLKVVATDQPAHHHGATDKCYVIVGPLQELTIRCHACPGSQSIPSPLVVEPSEQMILAKFNAAWAKLSGSEVLRLPFELADGSLAAPTVFRQQDFLNEVARLTEKIKVDKKTLSWGQFWLESEHATRYPCGLICDPNYEADPRYYNTFQGFDRPTVLAADRCVHLTNEELVARFPVWSAVLQQNICGDDPVLLEYALNWMAHLIQFPGTKPRVALVLLGTPGCGKGQTVQMLMRIVGSNYAVQVGSGGLVDHWNELVQTACLVFADEARADENSLNILKSLITEERQQINRKYQHTQTARTFQHLIFANNDSRAVFLQPGERRFAAFHCDYRIAPQNSAEEIACRVPLAREIESPEARGALLEFLRRRHIEDWEPHPFPCTRAQWVLQHASLPEAGKFLYSLLSSGHITTATWHPNNEERQVAANAWIAAYSRFDGELTLGSVGSDVFERDVALPCDLMYFGFQRRFPHSKLSESGFWTYLYTFCPKADWNRARPSIAGHRIWTFQMPERDRLRTAFLNHLSNLDDRVWGEEWNLDE